MRQQDFAIANPRPPSIPRFAIVSLDPQLPQRRASGAVRSVDGARLAGERAAAEDEPIFIRVVAVCCRAPSLPRTLPPSHPDRPTNAIVDIIAPPLAPAVPA